MRLGGGAIWPAPPGCERVWQSGRSSARAASLLFFRLLLPVPRPLLLRATLRVATKGVFGTLVFFLSVFGYAFGVGFVLVALAKAIVPSHTGAWVQDGRLIAAGALEYGIPPQAHEVLGMWIIPLGLVLGSLTLLLTTWSIRTSLRLSHRWQAGL